jgi:hypothetical protein
MTKPIFTDRSGRAWTFHDFRVADDGPQPVDLNHRSGEYRAFADDTGTVLVYKFGDTSYRTVEPNVLEAQLMFAKPSPPRREVESSHRTRT